MTSCVHCHFMTEKLYRDGETNKGCVTNKKRPINVQHGDKILFKSPAIMSTWFWVGNSFLIGYGSSPARTPFLRLRTNHVLLAPKHSTNVDVVEGGDDEAYGYDDRVYNVACRSVQDVYQRVENRDEHQQKNHHCYPFPCDRHPVLEM